MRRAYSREYTAWMNMRARCRNPKRRDWKWYGGKGITVCERWNVYAHFLADMGPSPGKGWSIDRRDGSKGYEPGNCRWATQVEQVANSDHKVPPPRRGAAHHATRLSDADVAAIRAATGHRIGAALARQYGVSTGHICGILRGRKR